MIDGFSLDEMEATDGRDMRQKGVEDSYEANNDIWSRERKTRTDCM